MPSYAMVVDQRRCVACMACVVACKKENEVPPGQFRTPSSRWWRANSPGCAWSCNSELCSGLCNHCDNPPCFYNGPTGA